VGKILTSDSFGSKLSGTVRIGRSKERMNTEREDAWVVKIERKVILGSKGNHIGKKKNYKEQRH